MTRSRVKALYVLGGGGHGRVAIDALLNDRAITGILDPHLLPSTQILGVPVLGGDEYLQDISTESVQLVNGVGANPQTARRRDLFLTLKAKGFTFASILHSTAAIGRESQLEEGSQVMAGAVIQCCSIVGKNAVINTGAKIDHDCAIAPHVFIAPGVILCGAVRVAEAAFIGAGAVVIPGVEIGTNAIVGAGATVIQSVPAGWIVAGNPAVKIGMNQSSRLNT